MNGKTYFRDCCTELGIDMDAYFLLCSQTVTNKGDYYKYTCRQEKRKTQRYAVKFFEKEGFYIAWGLKVPYAKLKIGFSVLKKSVNGKIDASKKEKIYTVDKQLNTIGGEEELVYVFYSEAVKTFLEKYIKYITM